jgi:hypothetical protein
MPLQVPGQAQQAVMDGVIDYAGLFPPAALSMSAALDEYAAASRGADAHMLGRFVLAASQLPAFADAVAARTDLPSPMPLSVIVRDQSGDDREAVTRHDASPLAARAPIASIEARPASPEGIAWVAQAFGDGRDLYIELDLLADREPFLDAMARHGLRAKMRTGGLTPDAFPSPDALLHAIDALLALRIPFKATAGLHHAVRGSYPLTYAPESAQAMMYGYLNVLLATAALRDGRPHAEARALLLHDAPVVVGASGISAGASHLETDLLATTRRDHFTSFGSCSFREPAGEFHRHTAR